MERINGRKLKGLILDKGFTISELAKLAKCKPTTITQLMRGKTCRIGTLSRVATALDVRGTDLLLED